jgi:hypothetical protein
LRTRLSRIRRHLQSLETELAKLSDEILGNSWYANQVCKRVLIETDALPLREAHSHEMFKHKGVAPDAEERVAAFLNRRPSL